MLPEGVWSTSHRDRSTAGKDLVAIVFTEWYLSLNNTGNVRITQYLGVFA